MEKASTVIQDILLELLATASEQEVQAIDSNTVIRYMNRFMASQDAKGIELGYTIVNNPSDNITIPLGAVEFLVFGVAIRLANQYSINLNPSIYESFRDAKKAALHIAVEVSPAPVGKEGNPATAKLKITGNNTRNRTNFIYPSDAIFIQPINGLYAPMYFLETCLSSCDNGLIVKLNY